MKFIKVTKVWENNTQFFVPSGTNIFQNGSLSVSSPSNNTKLSWLGGLGGLIAKQQNALGQQAKPVTSQASQSIPPTVQYKTNIEKQSVLIPIDNINYMLSSNGPYTKTLIELKNNGISFHIEETIEQIEKQIHTLEFNVKMDEILK